VRRAEPLPLGEFDRRQYVEIYTRLIRRYPNTSGLYYHRGSHYGRLSEWDKAAADYRKAADLAPSVQRHREAEAAVVSFVGTPEDRAATCRQLYEECRDHTSHARTCMVLLCSLVPGSEVDANELHRIVDEVLANTKPRPYHELAKGMALYRLGRCEEALAILPNPSLGFNNPKDAILPVLFRAMAHHQLGDAYTSRKLLEQAHLASKEQIESPEGPILPYQDRPVVWCMIQTALREAGELMGQSGQHVEAEADENPEELAETDSEEAPAGDPE
jgi:tetratricopeptide (TPR) repeat protein